MKYIFQIIAVVTPLLSALPSMAVELPKMPSEEEIRRQQTQNVSMPENVQIQLLLNKKREQSIKALKEITPADLSAANKSFPKVDVPARGIDIEAIANRINNVKKPEVDRKLSGVYVFVTLSMPKGSLDRVISDAAKAKNIIVVRGLIGNSLRETAKYISDIAAKREAAWEIDPTKFTKFGVTHAPTTVVVVGEQMTCDGGGADAAHKFYSVEGDVSLGYALEHIVKAKPDSQPMVEPYLRRLLAEK